jgi:nicotinate-nucleotide adenylyltransferase
MKIGFLGGSFDPVHFGHLIAAQDVLEQFHLDRLLLVPAAQAPLKPNDIQSSVEDRLAMLRSATEWDHRLEISDYELRKGGISYTVDSVRHFRAQFPADELFWIIGGDQLPLLHKWKEIGELVRLIQFIYLERPKHPTKPHVEIDGLRLHRCDGHLIEISSSELRARIQAGRSLHYFCPQKVIAYIGARKLYRGQP